MKNLKVQNKNKWNKKKVNPKIKKKNKNKFQRNKRLQIDKSKKNFRQPLDRLEMLMTMLFSRTTNFKPKLKN